MLENIKKIINIVDEVTTFIMKNGNYNTNVKITREGNDAIITFSCKDCKISQQVLDNLDQSLAIPRQEDVDEYYWQLNGASETEMEFDLIGMMIDTHSIEFKDEYLEIILIRKEAY